MTAVYLRELRSYFITPIGYIYAAMFLAVSGLLFGYTTLLPDARRPPEARNWLCISCL